MAMLDRHISEMAHISGEEEAPEPLGAFGRPKWTSWSITGRWWPLAVALPG